MSKDRKERRHRRTARHPECQAVMAGADFHAVPSLSVAMGLEPAVQVMRLTGRCRSGAERDRGAVRHAVPGGNQFGRALCGATPGRRSGGWVPAEGAATCGRCLPKVVR